MKSLLESLLLFSFSERPMPTKDPYLLVGVMRGTRDFADCFKRNGRKPFERKESADQPVRPIMADYER